jgi:hypothetical protein
VSRHLCNLSKNGKVYFMGKQWRYGKRRFGSVAELLVRAQSAREFRDDILIPPFFKNS